MAVTQRCPECGEPVPPGARFCSLGHPQPVAEPDDGQDRTTDLSGVGYRDAPQDPMGTSALPAAPPPQPDAGLGRPTRRIVDPPEAPRGQPAREQPPPHPPERFAAAPPPGYPPQDGSGLQRVRRSPSGGLVFAILALGILAAAAWYFLQARGDGAEAPGVVASAPETATAQAPAVAPPTPAAQTYEIQAGDSLSTIAQEYGTTVAAIVAANDIADPNLITVGQQLVIPPAPETATVGAAPAPSASRSP